MSIKFVTTINCMDGRVQIPVNEWMRKTFDAEYVDTITEPGPVAIFAKDSEDITIASIKNRVKISIEKHGSNVVSIVAHHNCAGNPLDKNDQIIQLLKAVNVIKSWGYNVEVISLWVNENWIVERIS